MPETNLIERYQGFRTRRFLQNESRYRTWLPQWRTRSRRRILVVALAVTFVFMTAVGIVCHVDMTVGPLLWLPACLLFFPLWTMLQIVSGRQGDAPRDALDEWEIQQRNSARSIGLTVTQLGRMRAVGTVDELRGGGNARLEVHAPEAPVGWAHHLDGVTTISHLDGRTLLSLDDHVDDQLVLHTALKTGPVHEFSLHRPTLTDLFREVVTA